MGAHVGCAFMRTIMSGSPMIAGDAFAHGPAGMRHVDGRENGAHECAPYGLLALRGRTLLRRREGGARAIRNWRMRH